MSTHAHTPGPWAINAPCADEIVSDLGGADISVARMIGNPADAQLIAAAPQLLETLQRLLGAIDRLPGNNPLDGLADEARAIIARATGV